MPIRKYETLEAAERDLWVKRGDPRLPRILASVWSLGPRLAPYPRPRGIQKFASIEEANLSRTSWERQRAEHLRSERQG